MAFNRSFNGEEQARLKQLIQEGTQTMYEIDTLREGLRDTVKAIAEELTSTVAAGTTEGTTTFTATPSGDNTLAYRLLPQSAGTIYEGQYIDGYINYESGDEIEASAGQFLQMIELDENMRVAKFAEHELIATDIAS